MKNIFIGLVVGSVCTFAFNFFTSESKVEVSSSEPTDHIIKCAPSKASGSVESSFPKHAAKKIEDSASVEKNSDIADHQNEYVEEPNQTEEIAQSDKTPEEITEERFQTSMMLNFPIVGSNLEYESN